LHQPRKRSNAPGPHREHGPGHNRDRIAADFCQRGEAERPAKQRDFAERRALRSTEHLDLPDQQPHRQRRHKGIVCDRRRGKQVVRDEAHDRRHGHCERRLPGSEQTHQAVRAVDARQADHRRKQPDRVGRERHARGDLFTRWVQVLVLVIAADLTDVVGPERVCHDVRATLGQIETRRRQRCERIVKRRLMVLRKWGNRIDHRQLAGLSQIDDEIEVKEFVGRLEQRINPVITGSQKQVSDQDDGQRGPSAPTIHHGVHSLAIVSTRGSISYNRLIHDGLFTTLRVDACFRTRTDNRHTRPRSLDRDALSERARHDRRVCA